MYKSQRKEKNQDRMWDFEEAKEFGNPKVTKFVKRRASKRVRQQEKTQLAKEPTESFSEEA